MQLLQLRIKNLNSLKGEHLIDFENGPIGNTGLFAITGPTGAGKSTILDAITLALYNQTPRSGSVSKNDIARLGSIVTRNTDEAWAQLDYCVQATVYRSHWGISRNRNGNLRDYTLVLSKKESDGQFISVVDKRNEVPKENARLIGLNFDQFLRSILLSQGDFARFLKSNANERGELLEKITGTEIYRRLGRACYERRGMELKDLDRLNIQLDGIEILSAEERQSAKHELDTLVKACKSQEDKITQLRKQLNTSQEYNKLCLSIDDSHKKLAVLNKEIEAFKANEVRLEKHLKVLPLKAEIQAVVQRDISIKEKKQEETDKKRKLQQVKNQQQLTNNQINVLNNESETFDKLQADTHLLIKKVRMIDSEIKVAHNSYQSLKEQNLSLGKHIDSLNNALKELELTIESNSKNIRAIKSFLHKNNQLELAGEQLALLEQQLKSIETIRGSLGNSISQMETSPTKTALAECQGADNQLAVVQKAIEQSSQFIQEKRAQLPATIPDMDRLKQMFKQLQNKSQGVERLLELFKEIKQQSREKETLIKDVDKASKSIVIRNKELDNVENALVINQKHLDELTIRRDRELLEAKYEDARSLLKENEACPLCGSDHHPFVENYKADKSETEKLLKQHTEQHHQLQHKEKNVREQLSVDRAVIDSSKRQIDVISSKIGDCGNLIQQLIDKYSFEFDELNEAAILSAKTANEHDCRLAEEQIATIERLDKAIIRNKEFALLSNEMKTLVQQQKQIDEAMAEYGINTGNIPIENALATLKKNCAIYTQKKEQLEVEERNHLANNTSWKEKGKQLKESLQTFAKQSEVLDEQKQSIEKQKNERVLLFEDRVPEEVEEELTTQKNKLVESRKALEIKLNESVIISQSLADRLFELEEELKNEQHIFSKQSEQLNQQLDNKGFGDKEEALVLLLSEEEVQQLQQKQENYVRLSTELNHSIKEQDNKRNRLKAAIDKIMLSEPELNELIKEQDEQLKTDLGKAGSIRQQIITDKHNKEKQKEKVQAIEKQRLSFQRWDELSSLIGDATGNKFSRFAQELTLKQVLQLANQHLKLLTDRYWVKHIKNELTDGLFVVDLYHGNAERSVKTLSGGESFLVSLSLALGLSDLAGQNTVIGSLFIDEGFGTLDQNTLDVALSALEKLQSETNRTIGIISHVPALKERVTTQIELKKDASGYSTLVVRS